MDKTLHNQFEEVKCSLNTSLNYYGVMWARARIWLWFSRAIDFLAAAFAGAAFVADNGTWTRWIAILIATFSWLKTESCSDRRVSMLAKQYRQTNQLLARVPVRDEDESWALLGEIQELFSGVEDGDLPTIPCLMAVCENETRKKYQLRGHWALSWWQRHVGVYFRCIRCDESLQLVED